jgi:hypothetical protein
MSTVEEIGFITIAVMIIGVGATFLVPAINAWLSHRAKDDDVRCSKVETIESNGIFGADTACVCPDCSGASGKGPQTRDPG